MTTIKNYKNYLTFLILNAITVVCVYAQEKKVDVDIDVNKSSTTWYSQPWIWVVGAAVFILLMVALLRGGQKSS